MSLLATRSRLEAGYMMQKRVALVAFGIGLALFFVGFASDVLTSNGALGLHPKLANLFQPLWILGGFVALLGTVKV